MNNGESLGKEVKILKYLLALMCMIFFKH